LLEDSTGSSRSYDGAIVLHRKSEQPLVLRVRVEAQPWKWHHRVRCSRPQDSYPIQPRKESLLKPKDFAQLQESIQERVAARNRDLGNTGKPPDKASDPYTANPVAEVPIVRLVMSPPAQAEASIMEHLMIQGDETTKVAEDPSMANILIATNDAVE
jgi:hypothetical protein